MESDQAYPTIRATKDAEKTALHMSGSEPGAVFRELPPRGAIGSGHRLAAPGATPWEHGAVFDSRFS